MARSKVSAVLLRRCSIVLSMTPASKMISLLRLHIFKSRHLDLPTTLSLWPDLFKIEQFCEKEKDCTAVVTKSCRSNMKELASSGSNVQGPLIFCSSLEHMTMNTATQWRRFSSGCGFFGRKYSSLNLRLFVKKMRDIELAYKRIILHLRNRETREESIGKRRRSSTMLHLTGFRLMRRVAHGRSRSLACRESRRTSPSETLEAQQGCTIAFALQQWHVAFSGGSSLFTNWAGLFLLRFFPFFLSLFRFFFFLERDCLLCAICDTWLRACLVFCWYHAGHVQTHRVKSVRRWRPRSPVRDRRDMRHSWFIQDPETSHFFCK